MADVYLIRHGDYGDDGKLTKIGKEQSKEAGTKVLQDLKGNSFELYSSPKERAMETAAIAFKGIGIKKDERFNDPSSLKFEEFKELLEGDKVIVIVTHQPLIIRILMKVADDIPFIGYGSVFKLKK